MTPWPGGRDEPRAGRAPGLRPAHRGARAARARGARRRAALRARRHGRRRPSRSHRARRARPRRRGARRSRPGSATCSPTARPAAPPASSAPVTAAEAVDEGVQASWIALGARRRHGRRRPVRRRAADPRSRRRGRRGGHEAAASGYGSPLSAPRASCSRWPATAGCAACRTPAGRCATCSPPTCSVGRALPGARVPGRARPAPAPPSPTSWPSSSVACCSSGHSSPSACRWRRSPAMLRRQLVGQPGPAGPGCRLPGLLPVRGGGRGPVRRRRARGAPDRVAAVVLLRARPGRGGDRGPVAGRRDLGAGDAGSGAAIAVRVGRIGTVCGLGFGVVIGACGMAAARPVHPRPGGAGAGAGGLAVVRRHAADRRARVRPRRCAHRRR